MSEILKKIKFWYINSRPYSIPITFLSWLVIFCYSLKAGGNVILGIIAYFGIALVHLAANLADDYFDYKRLTFDKSFLENSKEIKCRYLRTGEASISDLRNVIVIMLLIAASIGFLLFLFSGWKVMIFAILALPIALFYSKLSSIGLGDIAVILAYGPLMFEGVFYVMTKSISLDVLILSVACAMFVNTILYAHMLMDFDEDVVSGKTTLCTILKTKDNALKLILLFYIIGYSFIAILAYKTANPVYYLTFLTSIMVIDLYKLLRSYNADKTFVFDVKFWHLPIENWSNIKDSSNAPFLQRFIYTRNISTWFMLLACIAIIFS